MMRVLYILLLWGSALVSHAQQDVMLTQFMFNKLAINPAYAGQYDYTDIAVTVRDQWNGFPGAPKTQIASLNLPTYFDNMGLGANIQNNTIGITTKTSLSLMYAYKMYLEQGNLSLGANVIGKRYGFDFTDSRLIAIQGIELDPSIPKENITKYLMNVGLGVYYNTDNYYVGLSTSGLLKNDIDFDKNDVYSQESRHIYLMGGAVMPLNYRLDIVPQLLIKYADNAPFDIDANVGLTLDQKYTGSITYRYGGAQDDIGESLDVLLSFQLTNELLLGFSLDFTLSDIRRHDNGSLELIARYSLGKQAGSSMVNPRYF